VEATADAGMATDPPTSNENNGEAVDQEQAEEAEDAESGDDEDEDADEDEMDLDDTSVLTVIKAVVKSVMEEELSKKEKKK
jgi:hypothetical protein